MDTDALVKLILDLKESLEREIQTGFEKVERQFEQVNQRFDQVNARLDRLDLVWKVARDWGRGMDDQAIKSDQIIARHERLIGLLDERLSRLEHDKQQ